MELPHLAGLSSGQRRNGPPGRTLYFAVRRAPR